MAGEHGYADTEEITFARIDRETGFLLSDTAVHNFIHRGFVFEGTDFGLSVQVDTPKLWHFKTGAKEVHTLFGITVLGGAAVIVLYEDAVFSGGGETDGTPLPMFNKKRSSSNTLLATFFANPLFGATGSIGDALPTKAVPGGTGIGATQRFGGEADSRSEWELKPDTSYIIQTTVAANGLDVYIEIHDTYEVPS